MEDFDNSTISGEQAGVVDPPESPTADAGAGQESVVGSYENPDFAIVHVGEDSGEETSEPDGAGQADGAETPDSDKPPETAPAQKPAQSAGENAAYRAMRLRAQHEAAAAARAAVDGEIAGLGIPNPYNDNKPFESLRELRAYSEQFKQARIQDEAKRTGRSVQELSEEAANREFISSLRREAAAKAASQNPAANAQREANAQKAFIDSDLTDFMRKHPEIDAAGLAALENNRQFRLFCGSRFGREPLAELYDGYLSLVGNAGAAAVAKAADKAAKSTGSGSGGGAVLSPSQKAVLDKWNADYPEMAMTAKEFLRR